MYIILILFLTGLCYFVWILKGMPIILGDEESVYPSVISPPPPSEMQQYAQSDRRSPVTLGKTKQPINLMIDRGDLKYMIDPVYREKTNVGTYVEGQSLVKPYKVCKKMHIC